MQTETPAEVKREVAAAVEQTVMESAPVAAQTYETQPVVSAPPDCRDAFPSRVVNPLCPR